MDRKSVIYQKGRVGYIDVGQGETIVLIHGYLESSEVWGKFADILADTFRLIIVDLPGNGRSSNYEQSHSMCFLAGAVLAVLDAEQINKASVIGHSLGGYVTLSMVEHNPQRVKAYVLLHSHPFADTKEVIENRLREIEVVSAGKKDLIFPVNVPQMFASSNLHKCSDEVTKLKQIASEHTAEGIVAVLKGMICRKSRADIMQNSKIPMLLVLGLADNYIPYKQIVSKINMPSSGKIFTLENSGHVGFIEETGVLCAKVLEFIQSLD